MITSEEIIRQTHRIYTNSPAVRKMAQLLERAGARPGEFIELIKFDSALVANLLHEYFKKNQGDRIENLCMDTMLPRLGFLNIKKLVLNNAVMPYYTQTLPGYEDRQGEFFRHSNCVFFLAKQIAEKLNFQNNHLIFFASILHDIGKLLISQFVIINFQEHKNKIYNKRIALEHAEKELLHITHDDLGAELLESWLIPQPIVDIVKFHHNVDRKKSDIALRIVSLANELSSTIGYSTFYDELRVQQIPSIMEELELSSFDIELILAKVVDELALFEAYFNPEMTAQLQEPV